MLLKRKARRGTAQSTAGAAPAGVGEALARSATAPVSGAATPASAAAGASATMEEVQARIAAAKAEAKAEFEAELAKAKAEADKRAADAEKRAEADRAAKAEAGKRAADAEKRAEADRAATAAAEERSAADRAAIAAAEERIAAAKKLAEATGGTTDTVGVTLRSHTLRRKLTPNIFPGGERRGRMQSLTVSHESRTSAMLLVRNDADKDFPLRVTHWEDDAFADHLRFHNLHGERRTLAENLLGLIDAQPTRRRLWCSVCEDSGTNTPLHESDYRGMLFLSSLESSVRAYGCEHRTHGADASWISTKRGLGESTLRSQTRPTSTFTSCVRLPKTENVRKKSSG